MCNKRLDQTRKSPTATLAHQLYPVRGTLLLHPASWASALPCAKELGPDGPKDLAEPEKITEAPIIFEIFQKLPLTSGLLFLLFCFVCLFCLGCPFK